MILYLSGPITRDPDYKKKFENAETWLKYSNHIVLNPAMLPKGLKHYSDYMKICRAVLETAEGIVMLKGWKESKGAKQELLWALKLGLKVYYGEEHAMQR